MIVPAVVLLAVASVAATNLPRSCPEGMTLVKSRRLAGGAFPNSTFTMTSKSKFTFYINLRAAVELASTAALKVIPALAGDAARVRENH